MKKIEEKYVSLLNEILKSKEETIDKLLRINENLIQETRNLIYEFREYLKENNIKSQK